MLYKDFFKEEDEQNEFKHFTFHHGGLKMSFADMIHLLETNIYIGDNIVLQHIKKYLEIYLPKYTASFFHPRNKFDKYNLFFGIDDFGIINGIPLSKDINLDWFKNITKQIIKEKIICDIDVLPFIDIEIISVNYEYIEEQNLYIQYLKEKHLYKERIKKYVRNKETFVSNVVKYNQKLSDLTNNKYTRRELKQYIKEIDKDNPVIKELDSDIKYDLSDCHEDIQIYKNDKDNIYHWVTQWKDLMVETNRLTKPRFPHNIPNNLTPFNILCNMDEMIPIWKNYCNINIFVIKIIFNKPTIKYIKYKDNHDNIIESYRTTCYDNPCCYPI